ncbi:MAG: M1 family peptidase, partial [Ginsengibacter sp.]
MKKLAAAFSLLSLCFSAIAQQFTHADTLRGSNSRSRSWWDVTKYDLHVKFNLQDSTISGYNVISFNALKADSLMQIDLQEPMIIDSMKFWDNVTMVNFSSNNFKKAGNAYFIDIPYLKIRAFAFQNKFSLTVYYHGKPKVAVKPPWDGGLIWAKDKAGNPWISIACQGLGASVWYPCKDIQSDEPDSAEIHITAPSDLVAVSNGRLRNIADNNDGTSTTSWAVVNPINNYNLIPYIGKYVHFGEIYNGEK